MGSLVRFPGLGALPAFDIGSPGELGLHEINNWLAGVNPKSPDGMNNRQLIDKAKQVEASSKGIFDQPEGATARNKAIALEGGLERSWNDILAAAAQISALGPPPEMPAPFTAQRPGENFLNNRAQDEWNALKAQADGRLEQWRSDFANWNAKRNALTNKIQLGVGASFSDKLVDYVVGVQNLASSVHKLNVAKVEEQTAKVEQASGGLKIDTFVAEQKLKEAKREAAKAESAVGGISPVMIAVGVGVVGIGAYFLTRKKSSVAGYRRRSRR